MKVNPNNFENKPANCSRYKTFLIFIDRCILFIVYEPLAKHKTKKTIEQQLTKKILKKRNSFQNIRFMYANQSNPCNQIFNQQLRNH